MSADREEYKEPVKNKVRGQVLKHAVCALTEQRTSSPLVSEEYFSHTLDYACRFIKRHGQFDLTEIIQPFVEYWLALHESRVSTRRPTDLHALILCGPNPLNDFTALMELGIPPFNIWGIEGDRKCFEKAASQLKERNLPFRLHCGSLQEFFAIVPQQFDLVYFDACGPLLGGDPPTLPVLRELFLNQRLSPVSALITNFCIANQEGNHALEWAKRMVAWYAARYEEPVSSNDETEIRVFSHKTLPDEKNSYLDHILKNLEEYYSDFISNFVIEFSSLLLPWWRVTSLRGAARELFADSEKRRAAIRASVSTPVEFDHSDPLKGFGHTILHPQGYPHLWAAKLSEEFLPMGDPLRRFFHDDMLKQTKLVEAVKIVSLVRNYFESKVEWGSHNREACNPAFADVLENFQWFDSEGQVWYRMFCDEPLPNLIADLCIGQSGYPFHTNVEKMMRITYTAKATPMLTDVFIMDQARYLYDLIPAIPLFGEELTLPLQMVIRVCMDGIRRHAHYSCPDLFRGCALAAIGEEGFRVHIPPDRKGVTH